MVQAIDYYTNLGGVPDALEMDTLADRLYAQVFRHDFSAPGFALLRLGASVQSSPLRRFMLALKEALDDRFHALTGRHLVYLSMGRFDQQETTRFHLDGAPEVSFLMLGYEPSEVPSELAMTDYSRAAAELGITPRQFLTDYNPMFAEGQRLLAPFVTRLTAFDPTAAQVLLINNSSRPFTGDIADQLGVMHQATIPQPNVARQRLVNSTMLASALDVAEETVSPAMQDGFVETEAIAGVLRVTM